MTTNKRSSEFIGEGLNAMGHAIGAGAAVSALSGAAIGVGIIFGLFVYGTMRNPMAQKIAFRYVLLGFALTEAVGLLSIMMAFLILFT